MTHSVALISGKVARFVHLKVDVALQKGLFEFESCLAPVEEVELYPEFHYCSSYAFFRTFPIGRSGG